jgi:hypothetical protein
MSEPQAGKMHTARYSLVTCQALIPTVNGSIPCWARGRSHRGRLFDFTAPGGGIRPFPVAHSHEQTSWNSCRHKPLMKTETVSETDNVRLSDHDGSLPYNSMSIRCCFSLTTDRVSGRSLSLIYV